MTEKGEHDQKIYTDERQPLNLTKNINFGHIHTLRFVVLMILFHIFNVGHIYPYFGQVWRLMFSVNFRSCSIVKVPGCEFFGHILANFWSY